MCQQLMILVKRGERQFVAQCEHGTIHLSWGVAILNMRSDDFEQLAEQLKQYVDHENAGHMQGGRFRIFPTPHGAFHLWIGTVGLYLTRSELFTFVDMLDDACAMRVTASLQTWHNPLGGEFHILEVRGGAFVCN